MCSGSDAQTTGWGSMAALPPGRAAAPAGCAQARARYFNSANAFNIHLDPVPARIFADPAAAALAADGATGFYPCDQREQLGSPWPATTPFMLARYARIRAGDTLHADFVASGAIWYVIEGSGSVQSGAETMTWSRGDVLYLPAGAASWRACEARAAVLWGVTDEPLLAYHGLRAARPEDGPVHFKANDIDAEIDRIHRTVPDAGTSGLAVVFSSEAMQERRNLMPALTLSMNTLPPGCAQSPHRHNSAALTLIVASEQCKSRVDGQDCPWSDWATLVTPAGAPHSHHNDGARRADFLIVQDGGLYYEARTMGFEFLGE
ncbi:Gentisate 1%2C2-dioxygenase [Bordetella ansorpii]|uniref:Gentisate 1,2-dioxygenase n=1 Tax=Bordetella ansorpii TaxID=288768 RepID=A0A157NU72_9BORD|nr:cupin domain-containing protein [Bordetella ansorpii]SAI24630.1 Gentisate 1%2C2-dioxygenase [Bordetella ansorpii]